MPSSSSSSVKKKKRTSVSKKCQPYLSKKIGININEFAKKKRYVSRQQAIAVAYSQTSKKCMHKKKSTKSRRTKKSNKKSSSSPKKKTNKFL